jgi:hypothetical protein
LSLGSCYSSEASIESFLNVSGLSSAIKWHDIHQWDIITFSASDVAGGLDLNKLWNPSSSHWISSVVSVISWTLLKRSL